VRVRACACACCACVCATHHPMSAYERHDLPPRSVMPRTGWISFADAMSRGTPSRYRTWRHTQPHTHVCEENDKHTRAGGRKLLFFQVGGNSQPCTGTHSRTRTWLLTRRIQKTLSAQTAAWFSPCSAATPPRLLLPRPPPTCVRRTLNLWVNGSRPR